jgi:transposase
MIALPTHGRVYLACGSTDMRRGFDGLAVMVQEVLMQDPHSGALFAFKGKRGDLIKLLWWDGQGLCLFAKRLEKGRFIWPMAGSFAFAQTCRRLQIKHLRTKPYTPKTNGKAERFIQTALREWVYARVVILVATHRTTRY